MEFQRVKNVRLYETIIEQIKEMIDRGELLPGDKFPSERNLMEKLGVSRAVLREAFRVLESRGLVESRPGGGRYLRKIGGVKMINGSVDLERDALLDVIEAREIVEVKIVRLAVKRATDEEIAKLKSMNMKFHGMGSNLEDYMEKDKDLAFHLALAEMSHNFILKMMINFILILTKDLREKSMLDHDHWVRLCDQHSDIVEAVSNRQEEEAAQKMMSHLNDLRRAILSNVEP